MKLINLLIRELNNCSLGDDFRVSRHAEICQFYLFSSEINFKRARSCNYRTPRIGLKFKKYTVLLSFIYCNLTRCIVRSRSFNFIFIFESSPKYGIFGHWFSEVIAFEITNFGTHLVCYVLLSVLNQNLEGNPKMAKYFVAGKWTLNSGKDFDK